VLLVADGEGSGVSLLCKAGLRSAPSFLLGSGLLVGVTALSFLAKKLLMPAARLLVSALGPNGDQPFFFKLPASSLSSFSSSRGGSGVRLSLEMDLVWKNSPTLSSRFSVLPVLLVKEYVEALLFFDGRVFALLGRDLPKWSSFGSGLSLDRLRSGSDSEPGVLGSESRESMDALE